MSGVGWSENTGRFVKSKKRKINNPMTTHEILVLVIGLLAGVLIGAAFFGGLWWTVLHAVGARNPAPLFLASVLVRMTSALVGFYLVGSAHPDRLAACLLGFVGARFLIVRFAPLSANEESGLDRRD
jgi:F1F0 ATPase subunit 2